MPIVNWLMNDAMFGESEAEPREVHVADASSTYDSDAVCEHESDAYAEHESDAFATHVGDARWTEGEGMYRIIRGDLEPDMEITLTVNGVVEDISDATEAILRWKKPDGSIVEVELEELVDDVSWGEGKVLRVWEPGDTDLVGAHLGQVVVTRGNTEPQTFPSNGTFYTWHVYEQLQ